GDFYSFDSDDYKGVGLYIAQLVQSRIVGTEYVREFLRKINLGNLISRLLEGLSRKEIDELFTSTFALTYQYSESLLLEISGELPHYPSDYNEKVEFYRNLYDMLNSKQVNA
ncbi:MAG: hypothetical protein IJO99_03205, partial [Ruminococcus sp.]|nr:hypothetical protein [Ruminococcus sp.]